MKLEEHVCKYLTALHSHLFGGGTFSIVPSCLKGGYGYLIS